jgi:hypothetical protein
LLRLNWSLVLSTARKEEAMPQQTHEPRRIRYGKHRKDKKLQVDRKRSNCDVEAEKTMRKSAANTLLATAMLL